MHLAAGICGLWLIGFGGLGKMGLIFRDISDGCKNTVPFSITTQGILF